MKTSIPPVLITIALVCFALSPKAQAVSPAPDGGYPGGNTAEGQAALLSLTSGGFNTAIGFVSGRSTTTGSFNTAIGAGTLLANTADQNTATGAGTLLSNTVGLQNTANGAFALFSNTTGGDNTAVGVSALFSTNADGNTATGYGALYNNTTGVQNTAFGLNALASNTTAGSNGSGANTGVGAFALFVNATGGANTAIGYAALGSSTGGNNIALGDIAGFDLTTGNDNIDIGNRGAAAEDSTIRIGTLGTQTAAYIAGISGQTASGGVAVYVNADGKLGTATSSARFKDEIKPMDKASEAILAFKPVTFRYKKEIDSKGIPQFGLVAEEVEKVNPDLVARDRDGKPYTVRYEAVNAMLLNEFLKEHRAFLKEQRKIEAQEKTIAELKSGMTALAATVKEQASQIQKVSAQLAAASPSRGGLEVSKTAPQIVLNNQ